MASDTRSLIKAIFNSAVDRQPHVREAFVREAAGDDGVVAEEVLSLLKAHADETVLRSPLSLLSSTVPSPSPSRATFGRGDRISTYVIREFRGSGGMGAVYSAYDERHDCVVALKTLMGTSPRNLQRFKQEFRSFADIKHRNLVSLYEFIADGAHWCFTMELIEGKPFQAYVTGESGELARGCVSVESLSRLRLAFGQMTAGVCALHEAGKVHLDLKPTNVLVTGGQRVVVLDFGLGVDLDEQSETTASGVFGSVGYMSPEQASGRRVTPASDWYSAGVMLYQALTGRRPFEGSLFEVLHAKESQDPKAPVEINPAVPEDLNALCLDLLRCEPSQRPTGKEIAERVGCNLPEASARLPVRGRDGLFVGRRKELACLCEAYEDARRGKPVIVYVEGHSGAGKTALVRRFLEDAGSDPSCVVIRGRCHEQESIPFKALDSLIDSLVRYVCRLSPPDRNSITPRHVRALARVFQAFLRVPEFKNAADLEDETLCHDEPDAVELRRRAGAALRDVFAWLGHRRRLILFIDDLQWGDRDSASLLTEILTPPDPPSFLAIGCYRAEDAAGSPFFAALAELRSRVTAYEERRLPLAELASEDTRELTLGILNNEPRVSESVVEEVVRESSGRPFLVYELIEHVRASVTGKFVSGPLTLDDVLYRRIEALPVEYRRILQTVAVAGTSIDMAVACRAAGCQHDPEMLALLKAARLVRETPTRDGQRIEVFHDRVRETLLAHLPLPERQECHRRLAAVFEASNADAKLLADHYDRGGEPERAAKYYERAASAAADALAFDHAAALYRKALDLGPWSVDNLCRLREQLGDALRNAGRGAEAAAEYLNATRHANAERALDLQHRAALSLLTSGHVDEGLARLNPVLRSFGTGLASAPWKALASLIARRVQLAVRGVGFTARSQSQVPTDIIRRIDAGWSVVVGLSIIDPIRAADFQTRNLLLALQAGEPFRVTRALAVEAGHLASSGAKTRARSTLAQAEYWASKLDDKYAQAIVELARGTVDYFDERWTQSQKACEAAAATFREHCKGATWEIDTANAFSLWSFAKLGDIATLSRRSPGLLKEARERGDLYAIANLSTQIMALVRLASDDPEGARAELEAVMGRWSQNGYHVQHHDALLAYIPLELYCGNPAAAWERIQREWAAFRWSLLSHVQDLRIEMQQLRAYSALAMAAESSNPEPFQAVAHRDAQRLRKEKMIWTCAFADYIEGTLAYQKRDAAAAASLIEAAVSGFEQVGARLYATAARFRLAETMGQAGGDRHRATGEAWLKTQPIRNAARLLAAYGPGFPA